MPAIQIKNKATTVLNGGINALATVVTVLDANKLPIIGVGEYFYATVQEAGDFDNTEIVKVIDISVNDLTVERGAEGTTPRIFSDGAMFEQRITAKTMTDFMEEKQDTLVNQSNIKSVNGDSLLGAGNLQVSAGSGGYAANVYLTNVASTTVPSYSQISYTPETPETILNTVCNSGETLVQDYIFDGDVQATSIPAGEWGVHFYRSVSNTAGDTYLRFELFARTAAGAETVLFSVSSDPIEDTVSSVDNILTTREAFAVNETDRIGLKVYAGTTRNSDTTVTLVVGDGEAAYLVSPLELRHNQLRARDAQNAHPIDSISGLTAALADKAEITDVDIALNTKTDKTESATIKVFALAGLVMG